MKTTIARITLLCTAAAALHASAQSLQKEITVRHESAPERIDSRRLPLNPLVTLPKSAASNLRYSSRDIRIDVPQTLTTLAPASYGDTLPYSPFRGYASLGFMTPFNLDLSAGYKLLDSDRTRLNAWLQYNATTYRHDDRSHGYVRRHTATAGLSLRRAVGRESYIDASLDYTFARYNTPPFDSHVTKYPYQTVHRLNASALWSLSRSEFFCGIGAAYSRFAFANEIPEIGFLDGSNLSRAVSNDPHKASENVGRIMASLGAYTSESSHLGIDLDLSMVANSKSSSLGWAYTSLSNNTLVQCIDGGRDSWTHGLATFLPYYRLASEQLDLRLGARVQLTINSGKAFHIAPDASATWHPSSSFNFYVKAGGGEVQNTLASLYDVTPYTTSLLTYGNSHVPITAEAGFTLGPWRGAYVGVSATMARANDWLMPVANNYSDLSTSFHPVDMKGYKLAVNAGYTYRSLLALTLRAEMAPQKYDKGYYLWRDRARYVFDAALTVTPIKPLDITVGWTYRGKRSQAEIWGTGDFESPTFHSVLHPLGNISDLHLDAAYRFNSRWSAFGSASNLLNRKYTLIGMMPAQGIHGLVGANYNF